jgi:hypothetical protein
MRVLALLGLAAAVRLAGAAPLAAQSDGVDLQSWRLDGLRSAFCVQLLLDPSSEAMEELPRGFRPLPASEARNLHVSLRGVVQDQPEFAKWSPSRLCFYTVDTVTTGQATLADRSGKDPQLFGFWTVTAADPAGTPREVALDVFANAERMIRSAKLAGQRVHDAHLTIGPVPREEDEGGPTTDRRFLVKLGKASLIWDGRLATNALPIAGPVELDWTTLDVRGTVTGGRVTLSPSVSHAMVGALKVEGKGDLAKALRASPTRFVGPAYAGGGGSVAFGR